MENKVVDIFDISYEGAGVGKSNGQVVFVPKTLIGEKVEVEILKANKKFLIGKVSKLLQASSLRIKPLCPYFDVCGGCDFQHCDYETELELKKKILQKEFDKLGCGVDVDIVSAPNRFFYRNKIKFEVRDGKVGYFKAKSHEFFEVSKCPIALEKINGVLTIMREFLKENNLKNVNSVYVKCLDESLGICFLFPKNIEKNIKNIKKIEKFDGFSVFFAYGDVLEDEKTKIFCVYGNEKLEKSFDGKTVKFDISAFNQINDDVAKMLYDFVLEQIENERVINAYSGQGVLSYLLSKKAKFVYGIEYQRSAHECAENLIKDEAEYKIENVCGKVEDCLKPILQRDKINSVVLDPARDGCKESVLDEISNSQIGKIVYVSCNFSTLVRDLKILQEKYKILHCRIFDMFPCTANMETVVIMERKGTFM